jgi:integrase
MGRKPTRNLNLPEGMRARHRKTATYYFFDTGAKPRREIPLGSDYVLAVQKWAELTVAATPRRDLITFRYAAERYMRDVLQSKAPRTRKDNLKELTKLYEFFDVPPVALDAIEPVNVRQFLDWRGKTAKVRANREKALFSHIFNYARDKGLTAAPNPAAGIKGFVEKGRDAYIDDATYAAVWTAAEVPLRDAMDLAYLTGQRPADVLKLARTDIKDGELFIKQNKTGKRIRIAIEGELAAVIQRINSRKITGIHLITTGNGQPMSEFERRGAFDRAREKAIKDNPKLMESIKAFQFRDLRAKAGTDKEESSGIAAAQDQLGHTTQAMTAHYVRHRRGKLVKPTK